MGKFYDRARMTTATTGTGTITLGTAVSGYQTFAAAGALNGELLYYTIESGTAWEIGTGTYTSSGTTLSRTLIQSSTGSLLSLSGTAEVFIAAPAQSIQGAEGLVNMTGFTTTATAGATTTLTRTSTSYQVFTGALNQTVQLPSTATLELGWTFHICNNSTGILAATTSTSVFLCTIPPLTTIMATCISVAGNTAAAWEFGFTDVTTHIQHGLLECMRTGAFTL
jgi:hypothetical protein